jgi:hypothetical protein
MVNRFIFLFLFSLPYALFGQVGGQGTYDFINLPNSTRVASLGGEVISLSEDEVSLCYNNPALLNDGMANHLSLNYTNYFMDINYGYVATAFKAGEKIGNLGLGMHYVNYGTFTRADYTGAITGEFEAKEYAMNITWAYAIDSMFSVGVNLKPVYSVLETYQSYGLATDLAVTYRNSTKLFTSALVLRNLGMQFKPYVEGNREPLPFEVQLALSKRLEHAPFRFTITAHHLETLDMTYELEEERGDFDYFGSSNDKSKWEEIGDMALRHLNFSVEILPFDNFYFALGYNMQRNKELQIESMVSTVGLSWGFGLKISKFQVGFARGTYHLAGASNHFSLSTDLSSFYRRR